MEICSLLIPGCGDGAEADVRDRGMGRIGDGMDLGWDNLGMGWIWDGMIWE